MRVVGFPASVCLFVYYAGRPASVPFVDFPGAGASRIDPRPSVGVGARAVGLWGTIVWGGVVYVVRRCCTHPRYNDPRGAGDSPGPLRGHAGTSPSGVCLSLSAGQVY